MKRSALKRKTPLRAGNKRLRRVAKRKMPAFTRAAKWRREYLAEHPWCEIGPKLAEHCLQASWSCTILATDLHEIVKRSRGGSTTDKWNILRCCRECHEFTEREPELSKKLGLLRSNPKWRSNG